MLRAFLLVGLGGGVGCMARFAVTLLVNRLIETAYPLATFLINIAGCFLIGLLFGYVQKNSHMQSALWLTLATGFCGGFTTFSTFALENVNLFGEDMNTTAVVYTVLSIVVGILLCRFAVTLTS